MAHSHQGDDMKNLNSPNNNILVTGGAGFIGCNFIRMMLSQKNPANIFNLDALTYAGSLDNLKELPNTGHYHFIHGDITDRALVEKIVRNHNINVIIHFAAESHVDNSITGPATFIQTNLVGTFILLDVARTIWLNEKRWTKEQCHFHHISTDEVYGSLTKEEPAFTEKTPYDPSSPYSASKAGSDHLVQAYVRTYGLPCTTTNCSNNYGGYQHHEKFIPTIINSCLNHRNIPVYGDGSNIRDWLYVNDHCEAIQLVIENGKIGETYNVGGKNERTNLEIVHTICDALDKMKPWDKPYRELISFVKDRPGHDWRYAIDATKLITELNWQPKETFDTGIIKTIEFYLSK